jgi:hypothetical protein
MGLFKKKRDPISERARQLNEEIAALEAQIQQLSAHEAEAPSQPAAPAPAPAPAHAPQPRLRSTVLPHGPTPIPAGPLLEPAQHRTQEPVFEDVSSNPFKAPPEPACAEESAELGMRRSDLASTWQRLKRHLSGPTTSNPRLVNYLAAGSIQGLRPLRYEKRVARNRFLVLVALLILVLLGIISVFLRH